MNRVRMGSNSGSRHRPRSTRRHLALVLVALLAIPSSLMMSVVPDQAAAGPGTPGTPQPGRIVFQEDFSNVDASGAAVAIGDYQGGPDANGETYVADAPWTPGGATGTEATCNGVIMNATTPADYNACPEDLGWSLMRDMVRQIGLLQGMSAEEAESNQALTAYTNGNPGAGYMLQTSGATIPAVAGHYYTVSAVYAAINCVRDVSWVSNDPILRLELIVNGVTMVVGDDLDPCTAPGNELYENVRVAEIIGQQAFRATTTGPALGLRLYNKQATGIGNDGAFDLPTIVDVTPQLDKQFATGSIPQGGSSVLTFTITNTSELGTKADFDFTDTLPNGLTASNAETTCGDGEATVSGQAIGLSGGDLATGQASCTVTVDVTSATVGTYLNTGCTAQDGSTVPGCDSNVTTVGLLNAGATQLEVTPVVAMSITKSGEPSAPTPGDDLDYTVTVRNAGPSSAVGARVTDPVPAQVASMSWTCTPSVGAQCTESGTGAIDDTVVVPAGGELVYRIAAVVEDHALGEIVNVATVVPPSGVTDDGCPPAPGAGCTARSTANVAESPTITVDRTASLSEVSRVGQTVEHTFVVTNTGNVALTEVAVRDEVVPDGEELTVDCPAATLALDAQMTCTASQVVTQADLDRGSIVNEATASGLSPASERVVSTAVTSTVTVIQRAELGLAKSAAIADGEPAGEGSTILWSFVVTNTGNVTVTTIGIDDPGAGAVTCEETSLAPGESTTCVADDGQVITSADVDAGGVTNSATATGTHPDGGTVTSDAATATVPLHLLADTGSPDLRATLLVGLSALVLAGLVLGKAARTGIRRSEGAV